MTYFVVIDECSWLNPLWFATGPDAADLRGWRLANAFAVPGTGRRHPGSWLRSPRHVGVRRATDVGLCRASDVPPSDWDDIEVQANRSRNWKRHRHTQYHIKDDSKR